MEFSEPLMRPPQEDNSVLIRCTQGCTYNQCHFCYTSRGYPFAAVSLDQMKFELELQKRFRYSEVRMFLIGANSFALPFQRLSDYARLIREYLPRFQEISMFSRIEDIKRKSLEQLRELTQLGIRHLYIGVENGNDEALRVMNKGHTAGQALEQLQRLDEVGMEYTVLYILGMAGRGQGRTSAIATANLVNQARPRQVSTTGLIAFPKAPLYEMVRSGAFIEASEKEKIEEMLRFIEHLTSDIVFDAIHYLNPLSFQFHTSEEKKEAVTALKEFLAGHSEEEVERMVNRNQKVTL